MAITQPSKRSKAEAFTAGAPDAKPAAKLRGKRQTITFGLPPDLLSRSTPSLPRRAGRERE
jgi:hypothetical protein